MDAIRTSERPREFVFLEADFQALRALVKDLTGVNLTDQKRELVYARLARRLRALNLTSFREYRRYLNADQGQELSNLCNAITTHLTSFFREPHHFAYLRTHLLDPLAGNPRGTRRVRIWSSGCSTGEEAYSIAMTVVESLPQPSSWDIRILATDVASDVLESARAGIYPVERLRPLSPERRMRFFRERRLAGALAYEIDPELRRLVTFKQFNLMHPFPFKGPLDALFCRNVVIYFDKPTQRELFARMARVQRPGNLLFLGHSETLYKVSTDYSLVGRTIYRRS